MNKCIKHIIHFASVILWLFLFIDGNAQLVLSPKSNVTVATPDMSFNKAYDTGQDLEAVELLYKELNYYRQINGVAPCTVSSRTVKYAVRWGAYMVSKHKGPNDKFYEHSKLGPVEYHIPAENTSEILHLLYFDHRPSSVEIVSGLMYGIARKSGNVTGWIQSPGHNECMLQDIVKYFGASVYVFKIDQWWCVYSVVNFSTIE